MSDHNNFFEFPMSFAQKRLWFLAQLDPQAPFYNIPANLKLDGALNYQALEKALNDLVDRHEVLRTTFHLKDGAPVQRVASVATIKLEKTFAAEADVEHETLSEMRKPFDLSKGPLLRVRLLVLSEDRHILLCTMHHIVSDGWSMGVLVRDLSSFYQAALMGGQADVAQLPIQYGDYADWQAEWLTQARMDAQLTYWKEQLHGAPEVLDLPLDQERAKERSFEAASLAFDIPEKTAKRLYALCDETQTTPFMACLAVLSVVLGKYCRSDDIVVGSPVANRNRQEVENLIGFFVNTLVLRTDLSGEISFRTLLDRVRETALNAFAHQDIPFETLVEALAPQRHLNINPLFQVSYSFQNAPMGDVVLEGLHVQPFTDVKTGMGRFDLEFAFWEDQGLKGSIVYKTDIFEEATIKRMVDHLQNILEQAVEQPDQKIADLHLMRDVEREQMIALGSIAHQNYADQPALHRQFEAWATQTPDAIALTYEDQAISYGTLNARANILAMQLRTRGVKEESLVGVYLDRSLETVIAILAVLKAGGSYLPLEPTYQNDRLAFMIEDSEIKVLITDSGSYVKLAEIADLSAVQDVLIDKVDWLQAGEGTENLPFGDDLNNRAYVIYTSGSTGKPKGVEVTQRNVVRLFSSTQGLFNFNSDDVWTMFHSHAFDFSVWEIWGALLHGGRLVVVPYWITRNPQQFYALLATEGVTVLNQTPSAFYALIQAEEAYERKKDLSLRYVVFGGEALDFRKLKPWYKNHNEGAPLLVNMYGITETTVHASFRPLKSADADCPQSLIGAPLGDLRFYLLDEAGSPVPYGVKGEIHVGGAGVARGYFHRDDLNKLRFIDDPFAATGERLYRSGDLARWLPDGGLEYCGRMDDQVQIRGFRVELGEIQSLLCEHEAINDAVVLCLNSDHGPEIAAYMVAQDEKIEFPAENVRRFLRDKLPDYMIPAHIYHVPAIPLTAHGKVDRKALQEQGRRLNDGEKVLPSTPLECEIAEIWTELLKRDDIGVTDNFFALGGHSLLATQVVSRMQQRFGNGLTLRDFFEGPSIAQIVEKLGDQEAQASLCQPIQRLNRNETALSFAQERLWFLSELEGESAAYNIPSSYQIVGDLNIAALEKALNHVVSRHEILRTCFVERNGSPIQQVQPDLFVALECADCHDKSESDIAHIIADFNHQPFDLSHPPLVRWRLLDRGVGEHLLLICVHHIVSDGWSTNILAHEVAVSYEAFLLGQVPDLPALPIQYGDFAQWQRGRFADPSVMEEQLGCWRTQLDGLPAVLDFPCQKKRPAQQSYKGKLTRFNLPENVRSDVERLGKQTGCTSFMVLLSAFFVLLARFSRRDDLVVGSPIANRTRPELEGLVGFFANTLALRADLSEADTFADLLFQVRERALGAYGHQDLPFERLVNELAGERSLSHAPIFQIMFVLQNEEVGQGSERGGSLDISPLPVTFEASRFDMTLYVSERDGGYSAMIEYASDLFDPADINNMANAFTHLLENMVRDPARQLSAYPLIEEGDCTRLIEDMSHKRQQWPNEGNVVALFESMVTRQGDAPALRFKDRVFSYREINERANRLAAYLMDQGVGRDSIVALMMDRSERLVISLLAILKAGGAYLPIDPAYPAERVKDMLDDSAATILLGDESACEYDGLNVATLEESLSRQQASNPTIKAQASDLAYVLYTSGSTGKPKGVAMVHGALSNLVHWHLADVHLGKPVRTLHFSPFTFDVSFQEVFVTWCAGGCLYLADEDMRKDAFALVPYVRDHQIERMFMPYVALQQFATVAGELSVFPDYLQDVVTAGEQLRITPQIITLFEHLKAARLHNHYGPSETHVVTSEVLAGDPQDWPLLPSIGKPIANADIYILGEDWQIVPPGVPGELCVGGLAVARGYLGRDDLNAEKFVKVVLSNGQECRLYRTGDLALWQNDGRVKYLGRGDKQVKIRGFRIEPGEVETVLNTHAMVRDCCVVPVAFDEGRDVRLVAYYETYAGGISEVILRDYLHEKLPDYMVPSLFVAQNALPLTPSGKVDRARLPHPGEIKVRTQKDVGLLSPTEAVLQAIWQDVLGVAHVDVEDNFFSLGGHSLLATQLVSRIRKAFDCELSVRQIFETPTIGGLARVLENKAKGQDVPAIVAVKRPDNRLPLSFAQERLWFLDRLQGDSANYNMPAAIRLNGDLNEDAFLTALRDIVQRHEVLRSGFEVTQDGVHAFVRSLDPDIFACVDLSASDPGLQERQIAHMIEENALAPFDLHHDPLLAGKLVRLDEAGMQHIFLLRMHHIVADNWSVGVFLKELSTLYSFYANKGTKDQQTPLAPLSVQYSDFAQWQRMWLASWDYQRQLGYWQTHLAGTMQELSLSVRQNKAESPAIGGRYSFTIDDAASQDIMRLCEKNAVSLYMGLLALYGTLINRYSGNQDFVIGSPIANRHYGEIEPLIGFFVNTLPLRFQINEGATFKDLLSQVRHTCLDGFAHQDVPFEQIVRAVCPQRQQDKSPLVQNVFVVQNAASQDDAGLEGVEMEILPLPNSVAKFELVLSFTQTKDTLHGVIEYDTALFDEAEIEALGAHYQTLLQTVCTTPDIALQDIDLFGRGDEVQEDAVEEFMF